MYRKFVSWLMMVAVLLVTLVVSIILVMPAPPSYSDLQRYLEHSAGKISTMFESANSWERRSSLERAPNNPVVSSAPPQDSPAAPPLIVISASDSQVVWETRNATTCVASGDWKGKKSPEGRELIPSRTATYTITCSGPGGKKTADAKSAGR